MSEKTDDAGSYGASSIKVLKGLEAVRKRPYLYIGDTGDGSGLHNMVYEVVDSAINEALAGFASEVVVTLNADGSATVRDNGRGIPTHIHPERGISAAEVVLTEYPAGGGIFDCSHCRAAGDLDGVGVFVVNALSASLELKIWRDDKEHFVRFRNGVAEAPLAVTAPAHAKRGTEVTFWPSLEVFRNVSDFDYAAIEHRLRQLAFLNPGVQVVLKDDRRRKMCYGDGVADFVRYMDRSKTPLIDAPIRIACVEDDITVDLALWWNDTLHEQVLCFTNSIPQRYGGTHLAGFRAAFARVIAKFADESGIANSEKVPDAARRGLTAVLSVKMPAPAFSGMMTRAKLVSADVAPVMESAVGDQLAAWLKEHAEQARALLADKANTARGICELVPRAPAGRT